MNTIQVKNYQHIREELTAAVAITPGQLVKLDSAGKAELCEATDTFSGMIAFEDELQGGGIDDDYAVDTPVQVWVAQRGDIFNGLLKASEAVAIGDSVSVGAGGLLEKTDANALNVVGIAIEAITAGAGASARIQIRIV